MNKERQNEIVNEIIEKINLVENMEQLNEIKVMYLGKKGIITELSSKIKEVEDKKEYGIIMNEIRTVFNDNFEEKRRVLTEKTLTEKLNKEKIDVTLPSKKIKRGSKHPINMTTEKIEDLFVSMGYDVMDGPELETDEYCFEKLNVLKDHPARDMQDSFYVNEEYVLRTQTSSVQVRAMLANTEKTAIRMICPGKTYRRDEDATHSHQFNQVEGLVIDELDKNVSLADLKGTLEIFAKEMLGQDTKLRFRPSYFPFTEPSYEVDVSCFKCHGTGCNLCKDTGWIEVFAAGMVHPNVLRSCGYDPERFGGFAFGPGLDRITMFKYGITDIRYIYQNDIRFLEQFARRDDK